MRETCAKLSPGNWSQWPPHARCSTGPLLLAGAAEVGNRVRTSFSKPLILAPLVGGIVCSRNSPSCASKAVASCFKLHWRWFTLEQAFWRVFSIPKYSVWTLTAATACLWSESQLFFFFFLSSWRNRLAVGLACHDATWTSPVRFGAKSMDTGVGYKLQCVQAFQIVTERRRSSVFWREHYACLSSVC